MKRPTQIRRYRAGFLFCGLGAGARGFVQARVRVGNEVAIFENIGGVDLDAEACADFKTLAGGEAYPADLAELSPAQLRMLWGDAAPDAIFLSPPCKGFSALLSKASAAKPKYQKLNRLVLQGIFLALETWETPPALIVFENVPRIRTRGKELLAQVKQLLAQYGYRFHEATHDCGEVGGLAQHRRRYLLVARRPEAVSSYVYKPPVRRVRGCGEVLGELPVPGGDAGGELHRLPQISWLNWVRLALIPAGGDWRDLPAVVPDGLERRQVWARYDVRGWEQPARTVAGAGSNGGYGVADPRVELGHSPRRGSFEVTPWGHPAKTVRGVAKVQNGGAAVADPRIAAAVGLGATGENAQAFKGRPGHFGVSAWDAPTRTVTGAARVGTSSGVAAVQDPRLTCEQRSGAYGVLRWDEAAATVVGSAKLDNSRSSVADPRVPGGELAAAIPADPRKPAKGPVPVIVAEDGTWHRPLTTLELAALQGIPAEVDGKPLKLAGRSVGKWRERIGNAVPVQAAQAIAESLLVALLAEGQGILPIFGDEVWVRQRYDEDERMVVVDR